MVIWRSLQPATLLAVLRVLHRAQVKPAAASKPSPALRPLQGDLPPPPQPARKP